ncbi:hypothetical protein [Desulfatibacillum aliphaticivorans]|uniref:hypothetical protein n=1 Tax=Desulfatibacillum aliphaticivorans TaxID=218208 RepID=UPI0003FB219E|nr:hypothetical protein [Desulfatibacillum aliphaticivorans]
MKKAFADAEAFNGSNSCSDPFGQAWPDQRGTVNCGSRLRRRRIFPKGKAEPEAASRQSE